MKFLAACFALFLPFSSIFSAAYHYYHDNDSANGNTVIYAEENIPPFSELLISWNAPRPERGRYSIFVSVKKKSWSPWLPYAEWASDAQQGADAKLEGSAISVYQDTVDVLGGETKSGFRVKIVGAEGASIANLRSIHVCASIPRSLAPLSPIIEGETVQQLAVRGLSQMALSDERKNRLCSPTSTTAVIRFLRGDNDLDPVQFAESVWDASFDIFGNWVLNVAEAYSQLQSATISCWVERLASFQEVLDQLKKGFPVVISVKGTLPGGAMSYEWGHLLVVTGFDAQTREVICMDPAFNCDEDTTVRYRLDDLLAAWHRRQNVAYIFAQSRHLGG